MMLVCDACDKGYHTFCLQPAMESLPSDPWKCRVSRGLRCTRLLCCGRWPAMDLLKPTPGVSLPPEVSGLQRLRLPGLHPVRIGAVV